MPAGGRHGLESRHAVLVAIAAFTLVGADALTALQDPVSAGAAAAAERAAPSKETRDIYARHCAKCHGLDGTPKPIAKGAPRFTDPAWAPPLERLQLAITNGKGEMTPKFKGRLTQGEVRDLAAYLLMLKSK